MPDNGRAGGIDPTGPLVSARGLPPAVLSCAYALRSRTGVRTPQCPTMVGLAGLTPRAPWSLQGPPPAYCHALRATQSNWRSNPAMPDNGRAGGIRTRGLFVPNEAL